jgi:hypothetical protein
VWKGRLTQHVLLKVLLLIEQLHVSATVLSHHQVVTLPISMSIGAKAIMDVIYW